MLALSLALGSGIQCSDLATSVNQSVSLNLNQAITF